MAPIVGLDKPKCQVIFYLVENKAVIQLMTIRSHSLLFVDSQQLVDFTRSLEPTESVETAKLAIFGQVWSSPDLMISY